MDLESSGQEFREGSVHPWWPELDTSNNLRELAYRGQSRSPVPRSPCVLFTIDLSPSSLIDWRFHMARNLPFFKFQRKLDDIGELCAMPRGECC